MSSRISVLVAAITVLVAGCAKKESAPASGSTPAEAPAAPPSTAAAAPAAPTPSAVRVVEISASDTMKFSVTKVEAAPGELLRVVLRNEGKLPKAAMGHNLVLLKAGVSPEAFAAASAGAGPAKDYLATDKLGDVLAHTKLIGPNEKAEVTFNAPTEPGEYVYLCTFPAHLQAGMRGVLVVK